MPSLFFLPGLASDFHPPISTSQIPRITGLSHAPHLLGLLSVAITGFYKLVKVQEKEFIWLMVFKVEKCEIRQPRLIRAFLLVGTLCRIPRWHGTSHELPGSGLVPIGLGPHLHASFNLIYLPKVPPPNVSQI
jgi:hypothetical protein